MSISIKLNGYDLLGNDKNDGIRYAWDVDGKDYLLESAAFKKHRVGSSEKICGYTTSVSLGCILESIDMSCKFCRTGKNIPFSGKLSALDIAKQNVFMTLMDIACEDDMDIRSSIREFAYMGQGEPGFSYDELRIAILLTNKVMSMLNQQVHRHIISTCGVNKMLEVLKKDLGNGIFDERVTIHYSLHLVENRESLMPYNSINSFESTLLHLNDLYDITGEKPCVGIILFNNFTPENNEQPYSNNLKSIEKVLSYIDKDKLRLSLCEFNSSTDLGESSIYQKNEAQKILDYVIDQGYEVKLFSSFGKEDQAACGMLGSKKPSRLVSDKSMELEKEAERLLVLAYTEMECGLC